MRMQKIRHEEQGFTLIELLIVVLSSINSSAWKGSSANFALAASQEVRRYEERGATTDEKRPGCNSPGPRRRLRNGAVYEFLTLILRSRAKYRRWRSP